MQLLEAGQIWTYQTRAGEETSRIVICRVDEFPSGQIAHIQVSGLHLKNTHVPAGHSSLIGHMPFSSPVLRKSLIQLEPARADIEEFEDGYQEWRKAFDQGKAGVWTIPVREAIAHMESALNT
jgi:hypothetical protein